MVSLFLLFYYPPGVGATLRSVDVDWRGRVAESPAERPATAQAATGRAPALPALKRSGFRLDSAEVDDAPSADELENEMPRTNRTRNRQGQSSQAGLPQARQQVSRPTGQPPTGPSPANPESPGRASPGSSPGTGPSRPAAALPRTRQPPELPAGLDANIIQVGAAALVEAASRTAGGEGANPGDADDEQPSAEPLKDNEMRYGKEGKKIVGYVILGIGVLIFVIGATLCILFLTRPSDPEDPDDIVDPMPSEQVEQHVEQTGEIEPEGTAQ